MAYIGMGGLWGLIAGLKKPRYSQSPNAVAVSGNWFRASFENLECAEMGQLASEAYFLAPVRGLTKWVGCSLELVTKENLLKY